MFYNTVNYFNWKTYVSNAFLIPTKKLCPWAFKKFMVQNKHQRYEGHIKNMRTLWFKKLKISVNKIFATNT